MDGGDVEVLALEGNILTLRYLGACGGCPSVCDFRSDPHDPKAGVQRRS